MHPEKDPRTGGKDGLVAGMPCPPRPHQGSWSKWESASRQNPSHYRITPTPAGSACFATSSLQCCPTIFCTKAARAGTTWGPAPTTLPSLPRVSLAADGSFCSFSSTLQVLRHRERPALLRPRGREHPSTLGGELSHDRRLAPDQRSPRRNGQHGQRGWTMQAPCKLGHRGA